VYEECSRSLQLAAPNIQGWANILTGISDSFTSNDAALFASSRSGIDGEGGGDVRASGGVGCVNFPRIAVNHTPRRPGVKVQPYTRTLEHHRRLP
jgi:hypothetical protein